MLLVTLEYISSKVELICMYCSFIGFKFCCIGSGVSKFYMDLFCLESWLKKSLSKKVCPTTISSAFLVIES